MIRIYTDGGSRGNPGKSACSFIVLKNEEIVFKESKFLGIKTNNEAEYNAIISALNWISKNLNNEDIEIISDSELVIKQINGEYKVKKEHLFKLYLEVMRIIEKNSIRIKFCNSKRDNSYISLADLLVNQELDKN